MPKFKLKRPARVASQGTVVVKPPVVDRLVFLLKWGLKPKRNAASLERIKTRVEEAIAAGECKKAIVNGAPRYKLRFRIPFAHSSAFVQVGSLQPLRQKGGIRIDLNPSKMSAADVVLFHKVMGKIIGKSYYGLLANPLINHIDLAVDIVGVQLSSLLVKYNHGRRMTTMAKRKGAKSWHEGYNFGSVSSDYMQVVYSKDTELLHRAVEEIARKGLGAESLKMNVVKQLKLLKNARPMVRVEIRGRKMRGIQLHEVADMPNRFARFGFCDLSQAKALPPLLAKAFKAMCRESGVAATFEDFKGTRNVRELKKVWRDGNPSWWQPETIWPHILDDLKARELFPAPAFESVQEESEDGCGTGFRPVVWR